MSNENRDWTEPKHLDDMDWATLKRIQQLHREGKMEEAMAAARSTDTIVREEIPPQIWLDIGGTLTPTGLEKLRKSRNTRQSRSKDR